MKFKNFLLLAFLLISHVLFAGDLYVYVTLRGDNKIAIYKLDPVSGSLTLVEKFTVTGGPGAMVMDSTKKHLYIAQRTGKTISSYNVDPLTGKLTLLNTVPAADEPVSLALDETNKYIFSAYYNANKASINSINADFTLGNTAVRTVGTGAGSNPHLMLTDPSNRFAYISCKSGNKIQHYQFNQTTGDINVGSLTEFNTPTNTGPRHFVFHSKLPMVYFADELSSTASVYSIHPTTGALTHLQSLSTLPSGFTNTNTVADIHMTTNEKFLYVSNRGHNSIAAYTVNPTTGLLTLINQYATASTPRAFAIDPTDNFLFAAGESSANLASYRINSTTGELTSLGAYLSVGNSPGWVLSVEIETPVTSISAKPAAFSSFTFSPNPLSTTSAFSFQLRTYEKVKLTIFTAHGKPVRTLVDNSLNAGKHSFDWDGKDDSNRKVASGVYTAVVQSGNEADSLKVVVP